MRTTRRWALVALCLLAGWSVGWAAKEIEMYHTTPAKPAEGETAKTEEPKPADELKPAAIIRAAAERAGLSLKGELVALAADALKPTAPEEGKPAAKPEGGQPAPTDTKSPGLPAWVTSQPYADYPLAAAAAAELAHPKGQTLRVALFQFASPEEAWGFWSQGRGGKAEYVGQAAAFGSDLRVWQGTFAAVLSLDPPDARLDELRLTAFGRTLCAVTAGGGRRPEMADWLPTTNQVPQTLTYFHANGPVGAGAMALSAETEGVTAQYKVGRVADRALGAQHGVPPPQSANTGSGMAGIPAKLPQPQETVERGVVVRYPGAEKALEAWDAFVAQYLSLDPRSGTRGDRRAAPVGGGWNGIQRRGRVCAFAIGAPSRNQAEIMLLQGLSRAHD